MAEAHPCWSNARDPGRSCNMPTELHAAKRHRRRQATRQPETTETDATPPAQWVMAAPVRRRAPPPEVRSRRWTALESAGYLRAAWAMSGTARGSLRLAGAVSGWSGASQLSPKAEGRSSSYLLLSFCDWEHHSTDRHGCSEITSTLYSLDNFGLLADVWPLAARAPAFSLPPSRPLGRLLACSPRIKPLRHNQGGARCRAIPVARAAAADSTSRSRWPSGLFFIPKISCFPSKRHSQYRRRQATVH